jgi:hypothetical protein
MIGKVYLLKEEKQDEFTPSRYVRIGKDSFFSEQNGVTYYCIQDDVFESSDVIVIDRPLFNVLDMVYHKSTALLFIVAEAFLQPHSSGVYDATSGVFNQDGYNYEWYYKLNPISNANYHMYRFARPTATSDEIIRVGSVDALAEPRKKHVMDAELISKMHSKFFPDFNLKTDSSDYVFEVDNNLDFKKMEEEVSNQCISLHTFCHWLCYNRFIETGIYHFSLGEENVTGNTVEKDHS